jgi:hypothetical protein
MMMRMLEAGGLPVNVNPQRRANEHNPHGFYEVLFSQTNDAWWMANGPGKATKVFARHLPRVPQALPCRVVWMDRDEREIAASRIKMGCFKPDEYSQESILATRAEGIGFLERDTARFSFVRVRYAGCIANPTSACRVVAEFLGLPLDQAAMAAVVDPALYRNRG